MKLISKAKQHILKIIFHLSNEGKTYWHKLINFAKTIFNQYFPETTKYIDNKAEKVSLVFDKYLKLEQDQIGLRPVKYVG